MLSKYTYETAIFHRRPFSTKNSRDFDPLFLHDLQHLTMSRSNVSDKTRTIVRKLLSTLLNCTDCCIRQKLSFRYFLTKVFQMKVMLVSERYVTSVELIVDIPVIQKKILYWINTIIWRYGRKISKSRGSTDGQIDIMKIKDLKKRLV